MFKKRGPGSGNRWASLKRSTYGQGRSTDGAFSDEEMFTFLNGAWTKCRSTCVAEARYVEEENVLEVEFKPSGTVAQYPSITLEAAESFGNAPSKRGWIWDEIDRQGGDVFYPGS